MKPRLVLASFDRLAVGKGAAAHILCNARLLQESHAVSLVTLGEAPVPGWRHRPLYLPEPNWLRRALAFRARVARIFAREAFDRYHVRSPWEGLAAPADRPLIYEVNGLASVEAPSHFPALREQPALLERLHGLELRLLDRADQVLTPSSVTAAYLQSLGLPADRLTVVPNTPTVDPQPLARPPRAPGAPLRLVYLGTLTPWQGLEPLVARLDRLRHPVELTVLSPPGWRARALLRLARRRGVADRICLRDPLPPEQLGPFLATQDLGLAPLTPCERNLRQGCMPIKILDYAAAGLPVLAPDLPVIRDILGPEHPAYPAWSRSAPLDLLDTWCAEGALRQSWGARNQARVAPLAAAQRQALAAAYARL